MKLKHLLIEVETKCPAATQDISLNLENRQKAIDKYFYGPDNPEEPGDYWKKAAKRWDISEATAKTMKCANCAAFDVSDKMWACMEKGIVVTVSRDIERPEFHVRLDSLVSKLPTDETFGVIDSIFRVRGRLVFSRVSDEAIRTGKCYV